MKKVLVLALSLFLALAVITPAQARIFYFQPYERTTTRTTQTTQTTKPNAAKATVGTGSLTNVGDVATFDVQAGNPKNGTNFVGTYTVTKVDEDQFVISYASGSRTLKSPVVWINGTGSFESSPGGQKGKATAVTPGKAFTFKGEQLHIFFHCEAGRDSATGYNPNGKIGSNWFMFNSVKLNHSVPPTEPEPTQPAPTEPEPTQPAPTEPEPTQPAPTEPEPTQPAPTEPEEKIIYYSVRYISIFEDKVLDEEKFIPAIAGKVIEASAKHFTDYTPLEPVNISKVPEDGEVINFYYYLTPGVG